MGRILALGQVAIGRIQGGVEDLNQDLALAGLRVGHLRETEMLKSSEAFKQPCFHGGSIAPRAASGNAVWPCQGRAIY
jgi:hypothetical protein